MSTNTDKKSPDPRTVYADIIDHPHWQSRTRPHMSLYDRAAQFSPFAALTGYDDLVREAERETEPFPEENDGAREELDRALRELLARREAPEAEFTFFIPDGKKEGGAVRRVRGKMIRFDPVQGTILLDGGRLFPAAALLAVNIPEEAEEKEFL